MLEYQEFPASMVGERLSEGWRIVGPCRPYAHNGYSVWMERSNIDTTKPEARGMPLASLEEQPQ